MENLSLLFDLDGTLSDPVEGITKSVAYALEKLGHPVPELGQLTYFIGPPMHDAFMSFLDIDDWNYAHRAVTLFRERYTGLGITENKIYPGIRELLAECSSASEQMFIASTKPPEQSRRVIKFFEIETHFKQCYGAQLTGELANKVDLIKHVIESETLETKRSVMIGDTTFDMCGARENGMRAIGVSWGYGKPEELTAAGAERIVNSPNELVEVLKNWKF